MRATASEVADRPWRNNVTVMLIFLVLGMAMLLAALLAPIPEFVRRTEPPAAELELLEVPPFTLTERSGKQVSRDDLLGKVWIASFVFTHCTGPCPSVTATMAKLQADLKLVEEPNLRLVTFTVDPDRDNPQVLQNYAKNFRADPERWLFLTGEEAQIHELLRNGFRIHAAASANPKPPPGQEYDHSTRLVVVDQQGRIRGYYDGYRGVHDEEGRAFQASYESLLATVQELLHSGS
jgi:protein SCO1/2